MPEKPPDFWAAASVVLSVFASGLLIAVPEERWAGWLLMAVAGVLAVVYVGGLARWKWAERATPPESAAMTTAAAQPSVEDRHRCAVAILGEHIAEISKYIRGLRDIGVTHWDTQWPITREGVWEHYREEWEPMMRSVMGDAIGYVERCLPSFYGVVTAETSAGTEADVEPRWRAELLTKAQNTVAALVQIQSLVVQRGIEPTCDD